MSVQKVQVSFACDSTLPRDRVVITPHYFTDNPQALVDKLLLNLKGLTLVGATVDLLLKSYDVAGPPPHDPTAEAHQVGSAVTSPGPREVALCLSYYATRNAKRHRGRLYIPNAFIGGPIGLRPSAGHRSAVMAFGDALGKGLPSGSTWVVWSTVDATHRPVTDYWVDDEWDTVRSRGLRSTTRSTATIP
jgi:hypothetical protein